MLKLLLIILAWIPLQASTQISKGVTCIDTSAARKVLLAAKLSKVYQEENIILTYENSNLTKQIEQYQGIATELEDRSAKQQAIMRSYELKIQTCESENITILNDLTALQLKFKRRQRINFVVTVGAIAGSAVGTILLLK